MKRCPIVLKVKEHIIVYTWVKEDDEQSIASCNHITTVEDVTLEEEDENAPPKFEKG